MVCRRHPYMMYFGQLSSPRSYTAHQRGLVCAPLLIVPDLTRFFAGVSATTTVLMTFQLSKICSLALTTHYLNALCITQRTCYTPFFPRNQNSHTMCVKDDTATLLLKRLLNWTNVTILRVFCTKTVISFIFFSLYTRCCILSTGFSTPIYEYEYEWMNVMIFNTIGV